MEFARRTTRRLHDEHEAAFAQCARLEGALARQRGEAPGPDDPFWTGVVEPFGRALADEVFRHFDFEEQELFPLLEEAGEGDIARLLIEEHATIRECAAVFAAQLDALRAHPEPARWRAFRATALELTERLVGHAQKEEMALLPSLDDTLDDDRDNALYAAYAAG